MVESKEHDLISCANADTLLHGNIYVGFGSVSMLAEVKAVDGLP